MVFEIIASLLLIAFCAIPLLMWKSYRKTSSSENMQNGIEELRSLENSLSLMIQEIQDSVQQGLADMEGAAGRLSQMIEAADDRLKQLKSYHEFDDELKPITQPQNNGLVEPRSVEGQSLKHKEVHELNRKGWNPTQIARHVGMSKDEVQFIVNLMEINLVDM